MATASAITLTDATPTDEVYTPLVVTPTASEFVCRTPASALTSVRNWCRLKLGLTPASAKKPFTRVRYSYHMPNPDYDPSGTDRATEMSIAQIFVDGIIPDNFDAGAREDFWTKWLDLHGQTPIATLVRDLESTY